MDRSDVFVGQRVVRNWSPKGRVGIPHKGDTGTVQVLPSEFDDLVGVQWDGFTDGHDNDEQIEGFVDAPINLRKTRQT